MNQNNSPIPQPSGEVCPNCGAPRPAGIAYCAHCGAPLPPPKNSGSCGSVAIVLLVVALFLGALGFGALGACFLLLTGTGGGGNSPVIAMFGIAAALAIAAFVAAFFLIFQKK